MSYGSTLLLVSGVGADGATTFDDYSRHNQDAGGYTNAEIDTAQSKFYGSSILFPGVSSAQVSRVYFPVPETLGTDPFTISMYARFGSLANNAYLFDTRTSGAVDATDFLIYLNASTGKISMAHNPSGSTAVIASTASISVDTWYHVELVRTGANALQLRVDGTDAGTGSTTRDFSEAYFYLGGGNFSFTTSTCWINDYCVRKGVALHTSDFTPPGKLITTLSNSSGPALLDGNGSAAARSIIFIPRIDVTNRRLWQIESDGSGDFSVNVPASTEFSEIDNYSAVAIGEGSETDQLVTDIADDTDDIAIAFGYPNTASVTLTGFPASASGIAVDVSVDRDSAPFYSATGQSANGSGELSISATGCPLATGTRTVWIRCTNSDGNAGGVSNNSRAFYSPVEVTVS